MKIGKIIDQVIENYNKGVASDDSRLSPRFVYTKMVSVRNSFINQMVNKNQKVGQWAFQTLPCVELVKAPMHECPCLPPKGCTIYKTKNPIPETLVSLDRHLIQSVTTVTGGVVFSETSWEEKKYKGGNRYAKSNHDYYIRSGHIYVTQETGPTLIAVTGLWSEPLDAYAFPSYCDDCEGDDCIDCQPITDKEFPFDAHKIDTFIDKVTMEIMEYFAKSIEDRSNNTADSPEQQSK